MYKGPSPSISIVEKFVLTLHFGSYIIQMRLRTRHVTLGLVLVSTGVLKLGKPSVGRTTLKLQLKIKRKRKFSVRCLVVAVDLKSLTA